MYPHSGGGVSAPSPHGPGPHLQGLTWPPPFPQGLTAYHDISLDKCYVIELNTTIVLPPRNFWELLMNVKVSCGFGRILSLPVEPGLGQGRFHVLTPCPRPYPTIYLTAHPSPCPSHSAGRCRGPALWVGGQTPTHAEFRAAQVAVLSTAEAPGALEGRAVEPLNEGGGMCAFQCWGTQLE